MTFYSNAPNDVSCCFSIGTKEPAVPLCTHIAIEVFTLKMQNSSLQEKIRENKLSSTCL